VDLTLVGSTAITMAGSTAIDSAGGGFFGGFYAYPGWGYYCSDPAGYYPYVTQCNTGWQTVPAG
jgi:hypothetical protein